MPGLTSQAPSLVEMSAMKVANRNGGSSTRQPRTAVAHPLSRSMCNNATTATGSKKKSAELRVSRGSQRKRPAQSGPVGNDPLWKVTHRLPTPMSSRPSGAATVLNRIPKSMAFLYRQPRPVLRAAPSAEAPFVSTESRPYTLPITGVTVRRVRHDWAMALPEDGPLDEITTFFRDLGFSLESHNERPPYVDPRTVPRIARSAPTYTHWVALVSLATGETAHRWWGGGMSEEAAIRSARARWRYQEEPSPTQRQPGAPRHLP
jgi:hypothetical protein